MIYFKSSSFNLFLLLKLVIFSLISCASYQRGQNSFMPLIADQPISQQDLASTPDVCLTPGCVKTAADILQNIDEDVDPCDNFYNFACGGWITKHNIPSDRSKMDTLSVLNDERDLQLKDLVEMKTNNSDSKVMKMIKDMYDSCMDLKSIEKYGSEPLQKIIESLGGWPVVVGDNWDDEDFDWMETLFALRELGYDHNILIGLSVSIDIRNNTEHIIYVDAPPLRLKDRSYYMKGLNDSTTAAYFKLMVETAKELGAKEQRAVEELKEVLNFETTLSKYTLPKEERRNMSRLYNKYTLQQLQDLMPQINWKSFFNGLLNNPVTRNEPIIVLDPDFLQKFVNLIKKSDKRTISNYMMWTVVHDSLPMMSSDWRKLSQELDSVITGSRQEQQRWKQCLKTLVEESSGLQIALSSCYVKQYFKSESKNEALELVKYVRTAFLDMLDGIEWMDEKTKMLAKEKAKAITPLFGYPQELLNDTLVLKYYENLTITNKSYFENELNLSKWSTDNSYSLLRKNIIKGDWKTQMMPVEVNAAYSSWENSIVFPAAILQDPFFSKDKPHYLNFGGIGYVIGHEITHGFDDEDRQFDKDGNNRNWWDHATDELFNEKANCIVNQYSNYTTEVGLKLNGINTQGENIADNGGLKEAHLVWYSKERPESLKQSIIVDNHASSEFRIIGPMSNLKEFAKDFQCPPGSPMNPYKKCQV